MVSFYFFLHCTENATAQGCARSMHRHKHTRAGAPSITVSTSWHHQLRPSLVQRVGNSNSQTKKNSTILCWLIAIITSPFLLVVFSWSRLVTGFTGRGAPAPVRTWSLCGGWQRWLPGVTCTVTVPWLWVPAPCHARVGLEAGQLGLDSVLLLVSVERLENK